MPEPALRYAAATSLFAGLALLAASAFAVGVLAGQAESHPLQATPLPQANGTAALLVLVPLVGGEDLAVAEYAFAGTGTAYLLECRDADRLARGLAPEAPRQVRHDPSGRLEARGAPPLRLGEPVPPLPPGGAVCIGSAFAFVWPGQDPAPALDARLVDEPLERDVARALAGTAGVGAVLALAGGTLWRTARRPSGPEPPDSTVEALVAAAAAAAAAFAQARRLLAWAGFLGIVVWYPVAFALAWTLADGASGWAVGAVAALALGTLTVLWGMLLARSHAEASRWQRRLAALQAQDAGLLG